MRWVIVSCLLVLAPAGWPQPYRVASGGLHFDVGGFRLHLSCMGEGRPVVILDHGLGGSSRDWRKVQPALAEVTKTCVYDRAGYGLSDPGPEPRTSSQIASELRTLLERAQLPPPYVLGGHSFGGYNVRMFSSFFPRDTAAVALIDTPNEGQVDHLLRSDVVRQLDPNGVLKFVWRPEMLSTLSKFNVEALAPLVGVKGENIRAILAEAAAFRESGLELARARPQSDLPLIVIMHGRRVLPRGALGDAMEDDWSALQKDLTARYRNSEFIIAADSAHNVPLDQPELVIDALRKLVERYRSRAAYP